MLMKRKLGRSGIEVSAMGLGCWAIGGPAWRDGNPIGWGETDDRESLRSLERGFELGITFFDTAAVYGCGHSETLVGQFIANKRGQVVVATKFGFPFDEAKKQTFGMQSDPAFIRQQCDDSLRRLKTDYIDLFQYHLNEANDGEAVRDVLEDLVAAGKIRHYGWSTDFPERAAVFAAGEHCTAVQQAFNVFKGNAETLKVCEENGLASIVRSPLAMGILCGKFTSASSVPDNDVRRQYDFKQGEWADQIRKVDKVRDVLTSDGRTLPQGALAWLWARSPAFIPIPGFKSVAQVEENAGAMAFGPLGDAAMRQIAEILG